MTVVECPKCTKQVQPVMTGDPKQKRLRCPVCQTELSDELLCK